MKSSAAQALRHARGLVRAGETGQAEQAYRDILHRYPANRSAIAALQALLAREIENPPQPVLQALFDLYRQHRLAEARTQARLLLDRYPHGEILCLMAGAIEARLGRDTDALILFDRAIALAPDYVEAHLDRGAALQRLGRLDEALASYDAAIAGRPADPDTHRRRGALLVAMDRPADALVSFITGTEHAPDDADLYRRCGAILLDFGRAEEALACYDHAIALGDRTSDNHFHRGNALLDLGRIDAAGHAHDLAIDRQQGDTAALGTIVHRLAHTCHWSAKAREAEQALAASERASIAPFFMLSITDDPERQLGWARDWSKRYSVPHASPLEPHPPAPDGRIRIGYFSADFHNHATMLLMAGLFERHDADRFEVHAFSYGPETADGMRDRLTNAVARFHAVGHLSDAEIAARSRAAGIDIAIDLKGHTDQGRMGIFAQRAAPRQVTYLGYPGSCGAPFIDHVIADRIVIPEADRRFYSENILYLPHCYQANDDRRDRPDAEAAPNRAACGLPEAGFVFCSFNDTYKIAPAAFDIWMRLLGAVEGSVLWLLASNRWAPVRLRHEAERRGIDPARLVFAPRVLPPQHLARHIHADLFLDSFAYNAHTTASDALWAGVPVVTRMGRSFASRVAGSLLHAVGLPDLVTESAQDYEALALALARDPARLADVKARLVANRSTAPLFDTARFTRDIEALYRQIHADA